ncbi:MAG: hypothetical protein C0511_02370 [Hyphomicrobium sp.]|nr:hypothetical protein [Hyphomicrobium sp.]
MQHPDEADGPSMISERGQFRRVGSCDNALRAGLVLAAVAGLAGCSQSTTSLPDPASMPSRTSVASDRARHTSAIQDIESRGNSREGEALKQIGATR